MANFPRLTTGAVTQYPSSRNLTYSTYVLRFVDGREQRFRELRGTGSKLGGEAPSAICRGDGRT